MLCRETDHALCRAEAIVEVLLLAHHERPKVPVHQVGMLVCRNLNIKRKETDKNVPTYVHILLGPICTVDNYFYRHCPT